MVGHGRSTAGSYLAALTSPIPSHCAVIVLFKNVPVHQLLRLALLRVNLFVNQYIFIVEFRYYAVDSHRL